MKNIIKKILHFLALFFIPFYFIRIRGLVPIELLKENLDSASRLYSMLGSIFGMVTSFVIHNQWSRWDNLSNATKGELGDIQELYSIAKLLKKRNKDKLVNEIRVYLTCIKDMKWKKLEKGEVSKEIESIILNIQRHVFDIAEKETKFSKEIIRSFGKFKSHRSNRLRYSSEHLPFILDIMITLSTYLIIVLSMFIYMPNIYINFLFTISLSILVFLIYSVIKDLNHPYKPGNWHLAKTDYSQLLEEIK